MTGLRSPTEPRPLGLGQGPAGLACGVAKAARSTLPVPVREMKQARPALEVRLAKVVWLGKRCVRTGEMDVAPAVSLALLSALAHPPHHRDQSARMNELQRKQVLQAGCHPAACSVLL